MDASTNSVSSIKSMARGSPSQRSCQNILLALSLVTLVGSIVATGCLHSHIGDASFAIFGTGACLAGILTIVRRNIISKNSKNGQTVSPTPSFSETLQPSATASSQAQLSSQSIASNTSRSTAPNTSVSSMITGKGTQPEPTPLPPSALAQPRPAPSPIVLASSSSSAAAKTQPEPTPLPPPVLAQSTPAPSPIVLASSSSSAAAKTQPEPMPLPPPVLAQSTPAPSPIVLASSSSSATAKKISDSAQPPPVSPGKISESPLPLPDILNLAFDPSHPLMVTGTDASVYPLFSMGLLQWFESSERYATGAFADIAKIINSRISQFDRILGGMGERMRLCGNPPLLVRDLFLSWSTWPYKLLLATDAELGSLRVSSWGQDSPLLRNSWRNHWHCTRDRMRDLSLQEKDFVLPFDLTRENINHLFLVDLTRLQADQINAAPGNYPLVTFFLISDSEFQKIDISRIPPAQFEAFFQNPHFVQRLTPRQIYASMERILDRRLFANLSNDQVLALDVARLDRGMFDAIFTCDEGFLSRASELLPQLSLDKIYTLIPFFQDGHWRHLSTAQIRNFDISRIPGGLRQRVFNIWYPTGGDYFSLGYDHLRSYNTEKIYTLIPFFQGDHWRNLSAAQIRIFDLSRIPEEGTERQRVFNIWYPIGGSYGSPGYEHLRSYTLEKIYTLIPFFQEDHWRNLSAAQIRNFDLSRIPEEGTQRLRVFNIWYPAGGDYSSSGYEHLRTYAREKIDTLIPFFHDDHWRNLSAAQIRNLDIGRIPEGIRQRVFNIWYPTGGNYSSPGYEHLRTYAREKIDTLIPFFHDDHWRNLSAAQIRNFDIGRIPEGIRQRVFNIWYPTGGNYSSPGYEHLRSYNLEKIYTLIPFFRDDHWQNLGEALTRRIVQNFDFATIREENRARIFNILFSSEPSYNSKAAKFLPDLPGSQIAIVRPHLPVAVHKYFRTT